MAKEIKKKKGKSELILFLVSKSLGQTPEVRKRRATPAPVRHENLLLFFHSRAGV